MDTIDTFTLHNIVSNLVTVPEDIKIDRTVDEQGVLLSVRVNPKDMGLIIGKGGITSKSIQTILRAIGKKHEMNIRVDFLEPDGTTRIHRNNLNTDQKNLSVDRLDSDLEEFTSDQ